jgi:hypothetical protein
MHHIKGDQLTLWTREAAGSPRASNNYTTASLWSLRRLKVDEEVVCQIYMYKFLRGPNISGKNNWQIHSIIYEFKPNS